MNCKKCGSPLSSEDKFCRNCGAVVEYNNTPIIQNTNEGNFIPQQNISNTPSKTVNSKNGNLIICAIIVVILIVLAVICVPKFLGSTKNNENGENLGTESSGTSAPSQLSSPSYYKVNFKNFTFNIPDDIVYEIENDELIISDEASTWVVEMGVVEGSFDQIKNNKSTLQSNFQNLGVTANSAEVKNISGTEFVTVELTASGMNGIGAYSRLNSMYSLWSVAYNQDNDYDYDILKNVSSISSTATYNSVSNSIKTENGFNFNIDEITSSVQ